jgi:hypothetical protein
MYANVKPRKTHRNAGYTMLDPANAGLNLDDKG